MNILLIFFALPIATIILAIVLEKILKCPILTAATFFAIYLIVAFAIFNATFLIAVIIYTILAFIAAVIAEFFFRRNCENKCNTNCPCVRNTNRQNIVQLTNNDITRIANEVINIENANNNTCSCNNTNDCGCGTNDVATVRVRNDTTGGRTTWCCCKR